MKKILIYSVLCLIAALPVSAQKFYKDAINITNASLWQQGESLYINMQMDMRNLKVSNDRTLTLTPVLTGPDNNVVLPEIVISDAEGKRPISVPWLWIRQPIWRFLTILRKF